MFQALISQHKKRRQATSLLRADGPSAAEEVIALAQEIGLAAWTARPLCNSVVAEVLTGVLIALNRRYKAPGSGIRFTSVPRFQ